MKRRSFRIYKRPFSYIRDLVDVTVGPQTRVWRVENRSQNNVSPDQIVQLRFIAVDTDRVLLNAISAINA